MKKLLAQRKSAGKWLISKILFYNQKMAMILKRRKIVSFNKIKNAKRN